MKELTRPLPIAPLLAELKQAARGLYGGRLAAVLLFGSWARGEAAPGSDIDVLIVLDGTVDPGEEIARFGPVTAALSLRHDVVLSCAFISAERYRAEQSPFLMNVRREGVAA